jgi:hypothetical protein|tara:strand:- start:2501 stop:2995 length:495 start_codon:yes stop_codon:yes gene_type:complete
MALRKIVTNSINDDAVTGDKLSNDMLGGITPVGGIILWSGAVASIGTGSLVNWALCDGTNGTPNLTDKFVVGAGSGYAVNATGGSADAIVVTHTHSITQTDHDHSYNTNLGTGGGQGSGGADTGSTGSTTGGGQANITIDDAGSSGTNANLPPYFSLAYIMRVS